MTFRRFCNHCRTRVKIYQRMQSYADNVRELGKGRPRAGQRGAFPCPVREIACQLIFKSLPMAKLSGIYVLREGEQTLAGMTVEIVLIRDVEGLTEILDEVLLVLDADRETY